MADNSTPSQAQAGLPYSTCPVSPTGHQWESLPGAAGWFGCAACGAVGICRGCLPAAVTYPASWDIPIRCEQHTVTDELDEAEASHEPASTQASVLWRQVNGVPTLEVVEAPAGAVPYQRMTAAELARLREVQQQWRMPSTLKRGDA